MAQQSETPPQESLPTSEEIAAAAADVSAASDELAASILTIEDYLSRRNLGVPAWVRVKGWADNDGYFWNRELGYHRGNNDEWQLAIRETSGHENSPDREDSKTWSFNRAPRKSRISAATKIPELLAELIKEAERTARRLRETTAEVNAFAATLKIAPKKVKR